MEEFFKYNRAYFVKFKNIESESYDNYFEKYFFPNIVKFLDHDFDKFIAIEEDNNGNDIMVIFLDDLKINPFINFCEQEDMVDEHYDISKAILHSDELSPVIKEMTYSDDYNHLFKHFVKKNMTIDIILDKISKHGKESLSEIDKQILANG